MEKNISRCDTQTLIDNSTYTFSCWKAQKLSW